MGNMVSVFQRFTNYYNTHRSMCAGKTLAEICTIMKLTPAEKEELQNNKFLLPFQFQAEEQEEYGYENFGLHIKKTSDKTPIKKTPQTQPKNNRNIDLKEFFPEIKFNPDGTVDKAQFTLKEIKKQYPSNKFKIVQPDKSMIFVNYKDGGNYICISIDPAGFMNVSRSMENKTMSVSIDNKGTIIRNSECINTSEGNTTLTYIGTSRKIFSKSEYNAKTGNSTITNYNNDGKIGVIRRFKEVDGLPEEVSSTYYSDNKPYKQINGKKIKYPLVDDLIADITAKNRLGLPTTRASISTNVLKRINKDNVLEICSQYLKQTGRDLLDDINSEYGLPGSIKEKLLGHIDKLLCDESDTYLAEKLYNDIKGIGSGNLRKDVMSINKNNVKNVLIAYRGLSMRDNIDTSSSISDFTRFISKITGLKITETLSNELAPYEGLLMAINGEWGLSKEERQRLIGHIVKTVTDNISPYASKQTTYDISQHSRDYHNVEIDLYRAINTNNGDLRNPMIQGDNETPSLEKFTTPIKQGKVGDCWLLAALNSAIAKPDGLKLLEDIVKYNEKNGIYTVQLRGYNVEYVISEQDVASIQNLSSGSKKVKAVEIAMDRALRDFAYKFKDNMISLDKDFGTIKNVDINGNYSQFLFDALFGYSPNSTNGKTNPLTEDFNKANTFYTFALTGNGSITGSAHSQKESKYTFIPRHEYSIIGSDEKNVYLLNPWDSSDKITISREELNDMGVSITSYQVWTP